MCLGECDTMRTCPDVKCLVWAGWCSSNLVDSQELASNERAALRDWEYPSSLSQSLIQEDLEGRDGKQVSQEGE